MLVVLLSSAKIMLFSNIVYMYIYCSAAKDYDFILIIRIYEHQFCFINICKLGILGFF